MSIHSISTLSAPMEIAREHFGLPPEASEAEILWTLEENYQRIIREIYGLPLSATDQEVNVAIEEGYHRTLREIRDERAAKRAYDAANIVGKARILLGRLLGNRLFGLPTSD